MQWNSFTIISNYMLIYSDFTKSNDRMKDKIAVAHQCSASNIGKYSSIVKTDQKHKYNIPPSHLAKYMGFNGLAGECQRPNIDHCRRLENFKIFPEYKNKMHASF